MLRLVGLDLDGTLIDSAPDLNESLGLALESLDLPRPTEAQTRGWIGDGIEQLIARGLEWAGGRPPGPDVVARALQAFDAHYSKHCFERSRVYPDVLETLGELRAAGCATACITNKRIDFARPILAAAGLAGHLDIVLGGDSCKRKKPYPDQLIEAEAQLGRGRQSSVLVGDSPNDMDAAAAAGWEFVYAEYGYAAAMSARGADPDDRIARFRDLRTRLFD